MTKPQVIQKTLAEYEGVDEEDKENPDCKCGKGDWCECYGPPVEFPLPYSTT